MSVAPRPELLAILGVERQSVDIVGRGAAGDSHDVVPFQIDSFILDLIFQDRVNSTVQKGILTRVEHFHRPHKALVDYFDSFRETLEMTIFKICALVSVTKGASLGATGLVDGGPNTVHFRAPAQRFGFLGGFLLWWGRGRRGAGLDLGVFVEVCEHLEPARSFFHRLRSGGLSLGQLEEPLMLGHQLVVVIIIIQIVNVIVIISRELLLLLLLWWRWLLLLHEFVLAVFTLLVGPRPLRPGRGWRGRGRLGLPLARRDAGAGRGGRGRGREQREARVGGGRGHGGSGGGGGLAAALRSAATAAAVVLVPFVLLLVTLLVLLV